MCPIRAAERHHTDIFRVRGRRWRLWERSAAHCHTAQMRILNRPLGSLRARGAFIILGGVFALGACSDSAATGGEGLIERDLAASIGIGELDAECEEPASKDEGETYVCTATTEDGRVIEFLGTVEAGNKINVVTTNLLTVADLDGLRADAAASLNEANGLTIDPDDIDCGDEPVILQDDEFLCEITDVTNDSVWELIVRTAPFEPGVGLVPAYKVGEQLR